MASSHVYAEIKRAVEAELAGEHEVVDFDAVRPRLQQEANRNGDLSNPNGFVALEELNAAEAITAFGEPGNVCMTESGSIMVHAYAPAPEASGHARALADRVRGALRNKRLADVFITRADPADPELMNEGLWSSAGAAIYYEYDFFAPGSSA